jgi:hypothetical protein
MASEDTVAARVVAVRTARRVVRPGLLWGLVFGVMIAATELTYFSTFPTEASRRLLATTMQGTQASRRSSASSARWTAWAATRSTR